MLRRRWRRVAVGGSRKHGPEQSSWNRAGAATIPVRKYRADSIVTAGHNVPAVITIDVEGFEGEVFDGMACVLDLPSLRGVCVELHFRVLNERGMPREPTRLVRLAETHDFTVKWTDVFHFVAQR
jgi:hypothetical protein